MWESNPPSCVVRDLCERGAVPGSRTRGCWYRTHSAKPITPSWQPIDYHSSVTLSRHCSDPHGGLPAPHRHPTSPSAPNTPPQDRTAWPHWGGRGNHTRSATAGEDVRTCILHTAPCWMWESNPPSCVVRNLCERGAVPGSRTCGRWYRTHSAKPIMPSWQLRSYHSSVTLSRHCFDPHSACRHQTIPH